MRDKSLLIPINSKGEILIQDRRNYHKPPIWAYFGGGRADNETPIEGMIRETKEELDLDLTEDDLVEILSLKKEEFGKKLNRNFFLYKTDQEEFKDLEANGAHWVTIEKARELLDDGERFEKVVDALKNYE